MAEMQTSQACPGLLLAAGLMCSAWLVLGMLADGGGCTNQTKALKSSLHSSWYSAFSSPVRPLNLWTVFPAQGSSLGDAGSVRKIQLLAGK